MQEVRYAGFWPRLGAILLDCLFYSPVIGFTLWCYGHFRLSEFYLFIPMLLLNLWYNVYLVKRFGGTPGKIILKLRIVPLDGHPMDYRTALLRESVDLIFSLVTSVVFLVAAFQITDSEFVPLDFMKRLELKNQHLPHWDRYVDWLSYIWSASELVVLLTNKKRRALHDFIAGTVVIRTSPVPKREEGVANMRLE